MATVRSFSISAATTMKILRAALLFHILHVATASGNTAKQAASLPTHSKYQAPRFRWWWPSGSVDPDEVALEIADIVNAGFGGGEISDVYDSEHAWMEPKIYGFGQSRWVAAVQRAYEEGNK